MSPRKFFAACGLLLAGLVASAPPAVAQDENFHIYLAIGQSNMVGATKFTPGTEVVDPRVRMLQSITCDDLGRSFGEWYPAAPPLFGCGGGTGLADSFLHTLVAAMPQEVTVGIVPTAIAGSDIALFEKSAPIGRGSATEIRFPPQFAGGYEWVLELARRAQKAGVIKGIIFHQGETNAGDENWKLQVQQLVADLKADLDLADLPFVAGELMGAGVGGCCGFHNYLIWDLPKLIPNAHVVSSAGLTGFDNAHFTPDSYREFGRRYASIMLGALATESDVQPNVGCGTTGGHAICCASATADWDGNGWGYQVSQSCLIEEETDVRGETPEPQGCGTVGDYPACCKGVSADSDGDGWGWENQRSCRVKSDVVEPPVVEPVTPTAPLSCGQSGSRPICCNAALSDPDKDGWGWENQQTCVVPVVGVDNQVVTPVSNSCGMVRDRPVCCNGVASDPDRDGWGWENRQTCVVHNP